MNFQKKTFLGNVLKKLTIFKKFPELLCATSIVAIFGKSIAFLLFMEIKLQLIPFRLRLTFRDK